jgi:peptidoglycan/LPS O-acetylase OafA/YrhL
VRNRFLIYTGTIRYGIYLLEKIQTDTAMSLNLDQRHAAFVLPLTAVATFGLAMLSWNLLEKPFLGLKRFFERERPAVRPSREAIVGAP